MPVVTNEGVEVWLSSRGGAGRREEKASWPLQLAVGMLTAPHLPVLRCSQVTLLDFGASRAFGTEFTDHYIEVSINPEGSGLKPGREDRRSKPTVQGLGMLHLTGSWTIQGMLLTSSVLPFFLPSESVAAAAQTTPRVHTAWLPSIRHSLTAPRCPALFWMMLVTVVVVVSPSQPSLCPMTVDSVLVSVSIAVKRHDQGKSYKRKHLAGVSPTVSGLSPLSRQEAWWQAGVIELHPDPQGQTDRQTHQNPHPTLPCDILPTRPHLL